MAVKDRTVLVVDDTEDTRFVLKQMLVMNGYRVMLAANGQEALEMARKSCPDLILMDLNMPLLDGLATVGQVRGLKGKCANVPIIALTAYDTYGMKEAALEAGCDDYIIKPLDLDLLEKVLNGYLVS